MLRLVDDCDDVQTYDPSVDSEPGEGHLAALNDGPERGTVVVIDDEKSVVNFLRATLEMDGYHVYEALTGPLGLGVVQAVAPDVVVLDVMMPGMDGIEVCRRLKELSPALPVVILTARDDRDLEQRCYGAGADRFLTKPLLAGQLTNVVSGLQAEGPR